MPRSISTRAEGDSTARSSGWFGVRHRVTLLLATMATGLVVGAVLHLAGLGGPGAAVWTATTVAAIVPAAWWVIDAARHRRLGVDLIALLALSGTVATGEQLAGAVIAVMLASGRSLETWATGRSERELRSLLDRAPHRAHRYVGDSIVDVDVDDVEMGDLVLVKPGEVIPVDGRVEVGVAIVDESALTGESLPVERQSGEVVRSGTVDAGGPFDLRAITTAVESSYAGVMRLVASAEAQSAPAVRLADRWALGFFAVSLAAAGAAGAMSGLARAVAVLVVATPCPLILAVPVAMVSGLSRAAHRGVIIKGGGVLERLASARVLLFDKTGTLTTGRPSVVDVVATAGFPADEVLRLAASLDQVSPHVLAAGVVRAAHERGSSLSVPTDVAEVPGKGVRGQVEDRSVAVGKSAWVEGRDTAELRAVGRRADREGMLSIFVAVDGVRAGAILLEDPIRTDAARTIRRLREHGIQRIVMVTGDRADVAQSVGAVIGVDEVLAERTPADKVDAVTAAKLVGPTIMVGDGINDAPALALADVGVAIGARGSTASSEVADVVLTVDRLDRLGEAVTIARRALRIATESVVAGIGLSVGAMAVAAFGFLPATWGAITQEAIDLAVIVNALRVLQPGRADTRLQAADATLARRFSAEHLALRPDIEQVRVVADAVGVQPTAQVIVMARDLLHLLVDEVLPHEEAEDAQLYPMLARVLGGADRTATMSRAHVEIGRLIRRLRHVLDGIDATSQDAHRADDAIANPVIDPDDLTELRRLLYGLHAILRLHLAQEDEGYLSLADEAGDDDPRGAAGRPSSAPTRR